MTTTHQSEERAGTAEKGSEGDVVQTDGQEGDAVSNQENIENDYYEIEKILEEHFSEDGQLYYKIRWLGYGPEADSLEPAGEIAHCDEILTQWEAMKAEPSQLPGI